MCSDLVHQKCHKLCISLSKKYIFFSISEKMSKPKSIINELMNL